jgi:hypothetical protein
MTFRSYPFNIGLIALILFICQLAPVNANGQTKPTPKAVPSPKTTSPTTTEASAIATNPGTYTIKGALSDGTLLKFTHLAILDTHGKVLSRWTTDGSGAFKITGLAKGRYRLVNSDLEIDTPFNVPKQSENALIVNISPCNFGSAKAQKDIKAGRPMLLLSGGIAPVASPNEDHFEKKYTVKYHDFGDTPQKYKCSVAYNKVVFAFLDKKFGKSWRKDVRPDVIGLKR